MPLWHMPPVSIDTMSTSFTTVMTLRFCLCPQKIQELTLIKNFRMVLRESRIACIDWVALHIRIAVSSGISIQTNSYESAKNN